MCFIQTRQKRNGVCHHPCLISRGGYLQFIMKRVIYIYDIKQLKPFGMNLKSQRRREFFLLNVKDNNFYDLHDFLH